MLGRLLALKADDHQGRLYLGITYLMKGDPERALTEFEKLPSGVAKPFGMALVYFTLGNEANAQAFIDEFLDSYAQEYPVSVAAIYAWRGENDAAFEWMERGLEQRSADVVYILSAPLLIKLRNDPRYSVFVEKLGLLEVWQTMPP